ncbi:GrpB family protein [Bacillus pseudomycoides]|uniref:GrpB family protein n=1 Tax=Bacillus pseudomycoides TaxID=64104 RepID=UPI001FB42D44|nr:GrpB family protein [Bacillus pseudomycoides]
MHVYELGSEEWNSNILLRDYLKKHPDTLQQYYQLKQKLVEKHHRDRVAYTNKKTPFITDIIQKAKNEINFR